MNDSPDNQVNLAGTTATVFMHYYNGHIPENFPKATSKNLEIFRQKYPSLFKDGKSWSIDGHRKKLMDWLASYTQQI